MNGEQLFGLALGLQAPWQIERLEFSESAAGQRTLHLHIGFAKGSRFADASGTLCAVHDTVERRWQHLNFFEHQCYLHCAVPRIRTLDGKVQTVGVPWARPGSGFTLLLEAFAMALIERTMPVNRVAHLLRVNPGRIWTLFSYWVGRARGADRLDSVTQLGVDETSSKKGHQYLTLGVDLDTARVIHVVPGKGRATIKSIAQALTDKGVAPTQVAQMSMDLSPAFIAGAAKYFPAARITFDRFHVVKLLNEAMDQVRRIERREHDFLKGHKYTFLKRRENLTLQQTQALRDACILYPTLGEAYRLKTLFHDLWEMPDTDAATTFLSQWCAEVATAGIPAFTRFAQTVKAHWSGIVQFAQSRISNGILEAINSKVQLAKRNARGFRNLDNFINMIYFLCGKLKFDYPLKFT